VTAEIAEGSTAMNEAGSVRKTMMAQSAKSELQGRIRKIRLEESLVDMACDLCMEQVPIELAFQRIQDKAMEKMVPLLDTKILDQADIMQSCLEMVAEESERVAWSALRKGTELLEEGLAILEEGRMELPGNGYLN
jgi:hypothetical protein